MSITTKFIPHSLIGIVSALPALLVMPAMADYDYTERQEISSSGSFTSKTFSVQSTEDFGGAIYNEGGLTISGTAEDKSVFSGNSAVVSGGAIYNMGEFADYDPQSNTISLNPAKYATISNAVFNENVVAQQGGAIFNYGTMTIEDAVFTGNRTTDMTFPSQGGAIFNSGDFDYMDTYGILTISNATFGDALDNTKGNSALHGGAIANEKDAWIGTVTLNNVNFYYNKAFADTNAADGYNSSLGGAIWNQGEMTINGDTMFKGNTATGYNVEGGAVYNSGSLTFNNAVTFDGNTATDVNSGNGAFGGAFSNSYSAEAVFRELATFTNNKALSSASKSTRGGAINNGNNMTFENGAVFTGNEAVSGAAIYNDNGGTLVINDGTFTNNTATSSGGAIFNYGTVTLNAINENVVFSGNTANGVANDIVNTSYRRLNQSIDDGILNLNAAATKKITLNGGITGVDNYADHNTININSADSMTGTVEIAEYVANQTVNVAKGTLELKDNTVVANTHINVDAGAEMSVLSGTTFRGNSATTSGGAIYNAGALTISNAEFENNSTTTGDGGAIKINATSSSDVTSISNSTFTGNTTSLTSNADSGAISLRVGKLVLNNVTFDANKAAEGGAIETYTNDNYVEITNGSFENNESVSAFGALGVFGRGGVNTITDTTFESNHANRTTKTPNASSMGGGAIGIGSEAKVVISGDAQFINNTSATEGGAIDTRHFAAGDNTAAKLDITGATFTGNKAGVIYNMLTGETSESAYVAEYSMGGAISNYFYNDANDDGYVKVTGSTFTSNSAANGGAIYNHKNETQTGNIRFIDSNFTDNIAAVNGGAIYNEGAVTVAGTSVFSGNTAAGKANDIYNVGTLTFAADSTTTMDGGIVGTGATTLASGATLNLGTVSITQGVFTLNGVVNAELRNANEYATFDIGADSFTGTGTLNLTLKSVGEYNVFKNAVFDSANVTFDDSGVFAYDWNDAGNTITVSTKSANEIIDALDVDVVSANAVVNLATNTHDETAQQIGNALATALANGDTELVEHEVKKLAPEEKPVTHSVASSVQNQVLTLTANRMSGGMVGRAGGDEIDADYGFWAQGLYNKSRYLGEFDGQSRGVAVGFDALINKIYTLGIGYAFSNADVDVKGDGGKMDIDSHTVFVYGQYKPSNWFINATLSNTVSNYTEKAVVMLTPVETEYDVNSFGIQTMTGYDFASGVTPMVGMRYLHVSTDGHDRLLGYVDDSQSSFLSAVGGLKYAFDIQETGDVRWTPEVRAMATYDVISDKNGATVYVPGGSIYHVAGDRMSRAGGEFGLGLTAEWRGLELSVNYDLQLRKDYMSHTGMIKLRYEF